MKLTVLSSSLTCIRGRHSSILPILVAYSHDVILRTNTAGRRARPTTTSLDMALIPGTPYVPGYRSLEPSYVTESRVVKKETKWKWINMTITTAHRVPLLSVQARLDNEQSTNAERLVSMKLTRITRYVTGMNAPTMPNVTFCRIDNNRQVELGHLQ